MSKLLVVNCMYEKETIKAPSNVTSNIMRLVENSINSGMCLVLTDNSLLGYKDLSKKLCDYLSDVFASNQVSDLEDDMKSDCFSKYKNMWSENSIFVLHDNVIRTEGGASIVTCLERFKLNVDELILTGFDLNCSFLATALFLRRGFPNCKISVLENCVWCNDEDNKNTVFEVLKSQNIQVLKGEDYDYLR